MLGWRSTDKWPWVGWGPSKAPRFLGRAQVQGPGCLGRAQGLVASPVGRPAGRPGRATPGALTPPNRPRAICRLSAGPANHDHLLVIWPNDQFPGIGWPWPTDLAPSLPGCWAPNFPKFFWDFSKNLARVNFFSEFLPAHDLQVSI